MYGWSYSAKASLNTLWDLSALWSSCAPVNGPVFAITLYEYSPFSSITHNRGYDVVKVRNYRDENFNSNLHIAVLKDSIKLVNYFLSKKLDPNGVNKEGKTPLHLAMKKGNKKIIDLLIKNGSNTEFKDKKGKIPIDYASKKTKHYFIFENQ